MKIVLDTNVLISGIFFGGPPYQILKAWQQGKLTIVLTQEILSEYQRVAEELSKHYPLIELDHFFELLAIHAEIVNTKGLKIRACEDPDDNKFIECAIASDCKNIVSGDKHLLKLWGFEGISVLKPREFADNYLK